MREGAGLTGMTSSTKKEDTNMNIIFIVTIGIASALLGALGCAPAVVTPLPPTVRRIAVLPPYQPGAAATRAGTSGDLAGPTSRTIGDVLAQEARARLAEKGFDIIESSMVKLATKDRVPTSPQMAAQIMQEARLEAAALYIEIRHWEPTPDARGMKADGVIVALNVMIIDPRTGAILWEVRRPSRPVPLYGVVLTGQANIFVAEKVMEEVFSQLGPRFRQALSRARRVMDLWKSEENLT